MNDDGRRKALDAVLKALTQRFGEGTVLRLGDAEHLQVEVIPSGCLALDIALGVGGLPRGRVTEIYGAESSGKTTLCLHLIAEAQKRGEIAAFVDMEHALDSRYAAQVGVDLQRLYLAQPDTAEQALEICEVLIRSGTFGVVVLDSVAALVPQAEIEGEMGDNHLGLQARLMSQALRKLSGVIKDSNTVMVFTNQLREKIGVLFGNPETTSGGRALRFYASVRLDVRRVQAIKVGIEDVGMRARVRVTKNKVAPPLREAEFDVMYGKGISRTGDLLDLGVSLGLVEKRGVFYSFERTSFGQGREHAKHFLDQHPGVARTLEAAIRSKSGLSNGATPLVR